MLTVTGATVLFGRVTALDGVDLEVATGEVVAILGPSGCGKSTLLRAVAGLQPLDSGEVRWNGEDLAGLPVHRRDFGLMFQEHALFSHRDVEANVAFGLRMQKMDAARRSLRVREVLGLVGLAGFRERQISTLSGGEAQRVALARSLAPEPRLLMLDEPLGSLDRPRREELTEELRHLLRGIGVTVLHVTHDHDEAFAVADRVAVMQSGRIARIGTPAEIWHDPRHPAVAGFLGHANVVTVGEGGSVPWGRLNVDSGVVVVRADAFRRMDGSSADADGTVTATVADVRFRGDRFELTLRTDPGDVELEVRDPRPATKGDRLHYSIDCGAVMPVDASDA
ncbi:MAG: ABC transporter ATP-binding protein [Acidimicrobiaceae bacterium]|nr:ABC transporter ATP-binding protein [Acidimicrobiaceae bacterium]MYE75056.1 ABC transporter ATP-binding protein [Acidimicrobiaceae bacterium]MYE97880.1 ABC transporter ATP-binding protein [Acidimicrobiaceae bacterium]MYH44910.1 ABC transporter ATP-binding protein [Acidimicrobiaceae bacterium]MYI54743.1 ABC transporter ATP-binding protein [Acidimicrobiaceae bacterium]